LKPVVGCSLMSISAKSAWARSWLASVNSTPHAASSAAHGSPARRHGFLERLVEDEGEGRRRQDRATGRPEVDVLDAEVREVRQSGRVVDRCDAEDVRPVVGARVARLKVDVCGLVARRHHVERVRVGGDGVVLGLVEHRPAQARVHDARALAPGVGEGGGHRVGVDGAGQPVGPADAQRHQLRLPVDARNADPVVADRPDRAGDVAAVPVLVGGVVVVVEEVPAPPVVDQEVAVVVDVVRLLVTALVVLAGLAGVRPQVRREIRMGERDPGVHDADDHVRPGREVPRLGQIGVDAGDALDPADDLSGVVHAPLLAEAWIVRRGHQLGDGVRLSPQDVRAQRPAGGGRACSVPGRDTDRDHPGQTEVADHAGAGRLHAPADLGPADLAAEANDDLARHHRARCGVRVGHRVAGPRQRQNGRRGGRGHPPGQRNRAGRAEPCRRERAANARHGGRS
jgi:hypothetical protein